MRRINLRQTNVLGRVSSNQNMWNIKRTNYRTRYTHALAHVRRLGFSTSFQPSWRSDSISLKGWVTRSVGSQVHAYVSLCVSASVCVYVALGLLRI